MPEKSKKTTWLWLRGLTRESRHWGKVLSQCKQHCNIITIDLPGSGTNHQNQSGLSIHKIAEAVRQQYLDLDHGFPLSILGMSMGGMVAHAWAQKWPDEINHLVMINSSFAKLSKPHERFKPHNIVPLLHALMSNVRNREKIILKLTSKKENHENKVLKSWLEIQYSAPISRSTFFRQLIASARYRPLLIPPECNKTLWYSNDDTLVSPICTQKIAKAWGCHAISCPDSGHDIAIDNPSWFIENFLSFNRP